MVNDDYAEIKQISNLMKAGHEERKKGGERA